MSTVTTLAIRDEQQTFTIDQIDAIKRQINVEDVPDAELAIFFHQAKRTGLDPFAKQIYLIPRWNKKKRRHDYTIQTSIDGMRLIAARTGVYAGSDRPVFEDRNGLAVFTDDVQVLERRDVCAVVTVWKIVQGQRVAFTSEAWWSEFVQTYDGKPSNLWATKPRLMLAKCAEALALRKAFPAEMSGVYSEEEMHQADAPSASVHQINPALEASVARHPSSLLKTGEAIDPESGEIVDVVEPASSEGVVSPPVASPPPSTDGWDGPSGENPDPEQHKKLMARLHATLHETFALPPGRGRSEKEATAKDALLTTFGVESASDLTVPQVESLIAVCKNDPARVRKAAGLPEPVDVGHRPAVTA